MTPEREAALRTLAAEHARDFLDVFKALDDERQRLRELSDQVINAHTEGREFTSPGKILAQLAVWARVARRESEGA